MDKEQAQFSHKYIDPLLAPVTTLKPPDPDLIRGMKTAQKKDLGDSVDRLEGS
jgi:hypothetical protein